MCPPLLSGPTWILGEKRLNSKCKIIQIAGIQIFLGILNIFNKEVFSLYLLAISLTFSLGSTILGYLPVFRDIGFVWENRRYFASKMSGDIPSCDEVKLWYKTTLYSTSRPNRPPIPSWPMSRARRPSSNWPRHKFPSNNLHIPPTYQWLELVTLYHSIQL